MDNIATNAIDQNAQGLKRIAIAIEAWIAMQPCGPEMEFSASQLSAFNWESIGGQVLQVDDKGATQVNWMFHTWSRADFGPDFVFQRSVDHKTRAILAVFEGASNNSKTATTRQPV